jgi:exopolyphosphatase/guanosine-5'-triphosphate,3'-diphosphate pyrophosphatase
MLFDGLRSVHHLDDVKRDLLEYAGVLHDIGLKEGQAGHHKTSLQMILGDDQLPFEGTERTVVANVARYHRGSLPSEKHKVYASLKSADRRVVDRLASILKVADALDVSHASVVSSVECHVMKGNVVILLRTTKCPERELERADEKKDLFERTFKRAITFEWELA